MIRSRLFYCVLILAVASLLSSYAQGPLTPPGVPGPVMRSLDQLEPRIPITNIPYTITQSGSYYLAGNLTSTGHGIVVQASGVSLDLMGFTLSGPLLSGSYGVLVSNSVPVRGFALRNGFIMNFQLGVAAYNTLNGRYENLMLVSNTQMGVYMAATSGGNLLNNTIRNLQITESFLYGILIQRLGGDVKANTVRDNTVVGAATGIQFFDSTGAFSAGNIISGNTVIDSSDRGISIQGARNRVEDNHVYSTTADFLEIGFSSSGAGGNIIFNNFSAGYTFPYSLATNDIIGPIVTTNGALSATGVQSHPKANFYY